MSDPIMTDEIQNKQPSTMPSPSTPKPSSPGITRNKEEMRTPSSHEKKKVHQRTPTGASSGKRDDDARVMKLEAELNDVAVRHREELYWLKLELDTTRREKEAVEDRMAELYRDMQELEDNNNLSPGSPHPVDEDFQIQLQKYEKMVRALHNQIQLIRSSSDKIVKSLKDEISDLMDDKSRTELNLMNKLSDLDKQNRELAARLEIAEQQSKPILEGNGSPMSVSEPILLKGHGLSSESSDLKAEIKQLASENKKLYDERKKFQKAVVKMIKDKDDLSAQVNSLQNELLVARSSSEAVLAFDQMRQDREESAVTLDRAALIWDQANESIKSLESVMAELTPSDDSLKEDRERLLSTLETASLTHGQVKVSLMLIELKLRNNLACLRSDRAQLGTADQPGEEFHERLSAIQKEAMAAIEQVRVLLKDQMSKLEKQSAAETTIVRETLEMKVGDLRLMQSRQKLFDEEIVKLRDKERCTVKEATVGADESIVSRKVLEQLQNEVLQVVEQVKEKNQIIGRLKATTEEHKVRERALMEELKRLMKEQAVVEAAERQRRIDAQALHDDDESDTIDDDYVDCSSDECVDDSSMADGYATEDSVVVEPVAKEEAAVVEATE